MRCPPLVDNGADRFLTPLLSWNHEPWSTNFNWFGDGIAMPHSKNEAVKEANSLVCKIKQGCGLRITWWPNQQTCSSHDRSSRRSKRHHFWQPLLNCLSTSWWNQVLRIKSRRWRVTLDWAWSQPSLMKSKKPQLKKLRKSRSASQRSSFIWQNLWLLPPSRQLVQHHQDRPSTLTAEQLPQQKRWEEWVLQSPRWNQRGHLVSAIAWTAEEIAKAEGVIIAADKAVETARFDGKNWILKPVAAGIRQTEELRIQTTLMAKQMSSTLKMLQQAAPAKKNWAWVELTNTWWVVSQMLPLLSVVVSLDRPVFLIDQVMGVPQINCLSWFLSCISSTI